MAKTTGPLMSLNATGSLAKTLVFGSWRGVKYARQHVTPSNPNTTAQQLTRNVFKNMDNMYKLMGTLSRAPWNAAAKGRQFTGRNLIMSVNIPVLREEADMSGWVGSPGALGGLPPTGVAAAPNANPGELDVTVGAPAVPSGWTLDKIVAQAFPDRAPDSDDNDFIVEIEDDAPTADDDNILNFSGLAEGELYVVSAWTVWTRPDGQTAYGSSLTDTATPATT